MVARLGDPWVLGSCAFVFGTLVGSFLNVVIGRLPEGLSVVWPGSRCPACRTPIAPHHNIPILSWLALRGRCAACRASISVRYPVVEALTGFLFAACAARFGPSPALLAAMAFSGALVAVTFIDLDIFEIPDEITLPGLAVFAVLRPIVFDVPWWSGLVGAILGAAFLLFVRWLYFAYRGTEAMGLGDVKLIAMIGAFLGPGSLLPTLTIGSGIGALAGLVLLAVERARGLGPAEAEDGAASERMDVPEDPASAAPRPPSVDDLSSGSQEPWATPPSRARFGVVLRGPRLGLRSAGIPRDMKGRTHVRAGWIFGARGFKPRTGFEVILGLFQDTPGWGHFEGVTLGSPPRLWSGPLVGARTADVEVHGEDEPWVPPPTAVPFGPFLALGALATLLLTPLFGRWSVLLGIAL